MDYVRCPRMCVSASLALAPSEDPGRPRPNSSEGNRPGTRARKRHKTVQVINQVIPVFPDSAFPLSVPSETLSCSSREGYSVLRRLRYLRDIHPHPRIVRRRAPALVFQSINTNPAVSNNHWCRPHDRRSTPVQRRRRCSEHHRCGWLRQIRQ